MALWYLYSQHVAHLWRTHEEEEGADLITNKRDYRVRREKEE